MPDKRLGRLPLFSLPLSLGWTAAFCANMGGGLRLCLGVAWPRGGAAAFGGPSGRQTKGRRGQRPLRPLCALRAPAAPPRGQANAALPVGRIGFPNKTASRTACGSQKGSRGLANGAHGGAEGHQRQLCQLKVLFPPGDADDGDAPQAAKHKGFDSQGQAADQQPDDVGQ